MLRWLKTVVLSDEERRRLRRQAGTGKASASESLSLGERLPPSQDGELVAQDQDLGGLPRLLAPG